MKIRMLYDNGNPCNSVRVYSYVSDNDNVIRKFRIQCPHFDSDYKDDAILSIHHDGIWLALEFSKDLNIGWKQVLNRSDIGDMISENTKAEKAFLDYIMRVF